MAGSRTDVSKVLPESDDVEEARFPTLLANGSQDVSPLLEKKEDFGADQAPSPEVCDDEMRGQYPPGGTFWFTIWSLMVHIVIGMFTSSLSYIPHVGDSPVWLRSIILVVTVLGAVTTHCQGYLDRAGLVSLSTSNKIGDAAGPLLLVPLIFMCSKWCRVLSAVTSTSLIVGMVSGIVIPALLYKKLTGKQPPSSGEGTTAANATLAGMMQHGCTDFSPLIVSIIAWILMGPEYRYQLMAWVPL
jgi:hypothetical protein